MPQAGTQATISRKRDAADKLAAHRLSVLELARELGDVTEACRRRGLGRSDTGIDLVGTLHDGGLAAIQCKFSDADRRISKEDIDSFISASAKHAFAERLIVETNDVPWSDNAETMLHGQTIPTMRIGLRESQVDWSAFAATGEIVRPEPKTLRQDQIEALDAVRAGLAEADRGKLIMACGTGKTLTGLRIAEELAGTGGQVLVLVRSSRRSPGASVPYPSHRPTVESRATSRPWRHSATTP